MFGISGEHLLVLLVILLIFGPRRLPDLGHSLGKTMRNFREAMNGSLDNKMPEAPPPVEVPANSRIEIKAEAVTPAPATAEAPKTEEKVEKV